MPPPKQLVVAKACHVNIISSLEDVILIAIDLNAFTPVSVLVLPVNYGYSQNRAPSIVPL